MTHYFIVSDECEAHSRIFSVEAENQDQACEIFTQKAFPIVSMTYNDFMDMLGDIRVNVDYVGTSIETISL